MQNFVPWRILLPARSKERRTVLPSMATTPAMPPSSACVQAMKHGRKACPSGAAWHRTQGPKQNLVERITHLPGFFFGVYRCQRYQAPAKCADPLFWQFPVQRNAPLARERFGRVGPRIFDHPAQIGVFGIDPHHGGHGIVMQWRNRGRDGLEHDGRAFHCGEGIIFDRRPPSRLPRRLTGSCPVPSGRVCGSVDCRACPPARRSRRAVQPACPALRDRASLLHDNL